jgi:hypothetical protein
MPAVITAPQQMLPTARELDFGDGFSLDTVVLQCDQINIGSRARFVALPTGLRLEVKNSAGTWLIQSEWTEA